AVPRTGATRRGSAVRASSSSLRPTGGEPRDEVTLGEEEHQTGRDRDEHGRRGEVLPLLVELRHELLQAVGEGEPVVRLDEGRGVRHLTPRGEEGKERG